MLSHVRDLAIIEGRNLSERVFARMPKTLDVQSYRRASAQACYQQLAADVERIKPADYDAVAA